MDFKEATDQLTAGRAVTLGDVARAFGKTLNTISRMRSGTGVNDLRPPENWRPVVADLAEEHATELEGRVGELRGLAKDLRRG